MGLSRIMKEKGIVFKNYSLDEDGYVVSVNLTKQCDSLDLSDDVKGFKCHINSDVCTNLTVSYNGTLITDLSYLFYNNFTIAYVDFTEFNMENIETMEGMFKNCISLESFELTGNLDKLKSIASMFEGCRELHNVNFLYYKQLESIKTMERAFYDSGLRSIEFLGSAISEKASMLNLNEAFAYSSIISADLDFITKLDVYSAEGLFRNSTINSIYIRNISSGFDIFFGALSNCSNLEHIIIDVDIKDYFNFALLFSPVTGERNEHPQTWHIKTDVCYKNSHYKFEDFVTTFAKCRFLLVKVENNTNPDVTVMDILDSSLDTMSKLEFNEYIEKFSGRLFVMKEDGTLC